MNDRLDHRATARNYESNSLRLLRALDGVGSKTHILAMAQVEASLAISHRLAALDETARGKTWSIFGQG